MTVARLTALLWRRGGARQRATLALTAAGVLASTVLALLVVSVSPALSARADRTAWRTPTAAPDGRHAVALQRHWTDSHEARTIDRVDLAPGADASSAVGLPAPPGLDRFPSPGTHLVSPALAELLRTDPDLAGRYPGRLAGTIGAEGLAHAEELVVVVGRTHDELVALPEHVEAYSTEVDTGVQRIGAFATTATTEDGDTTTYRLLAQMAAVLLVVPTVLLIGAAARLTAAQREQRLAALRLAGATPATVVGITAVEIAGAAVLGTVAGIATYLTVLPLVVRIPLAGGPFSADDLRLGWSALAGAAVVVPLLAVATAVLALRTVVGGPLGAVRRSAPKRPSAARFIVVPVAWGLFGWSATSMRGGGASVGALVGLGAVILTLSVIGPWLAWAIGAVMGRLARGPSTLIAARRITDDPRAAYRTVSGMVLAGLIAGFLFGVLPTIDAVTLPGHETPQLYVSVPPGATDEVRASVAEEVRGARVWWDGTEAAGADPDDRVPDLDPGGLANGVVVVPPERIEAARSAVLRAAPDAVVSSPYDLGSERVLLADLGRASTVMSLAALIMATAAAAIGGAAAILDQRLTLARLRLVGTPIGVLQRARRWQTLVPLVLASGGALVSGAVAGVVMLAAFGTSSERIRPPDLVSMAVIAGLAVLAGLAVVAATRPLLVAVSRTTPRE